MWWIKTKFILPKKHTQYNFVNPFNDYKSITMKKRGHGEGFWLWEIRFHATLPEY